jgi:NAD(P)-dependent dehydrogenase (short-subunit alcohol dehydrogenase family)
MVTGAASAKEWRGGWRRRRGGGCQLPVASEGSKKKNLAEIKSAGGQATATHADMSKEREIKTMFARISREFGAIHILVNNAGIENKSPFLKMPVQDWDHVMAVNLRGVFPCSQLAARR